jgi:hypothetical protein
MTHINLTLKGVSDKIEHDFLHVIRIDKQFPRFLFIVCNGELEGVSYESDKIWSLHLNPPSRSLDGKRQPILPHKVQIERENNDLITFSIQSSRSGSLTF